MDPIADFLTRIRNANMKKKEKVDIPFSKIKTEIARILKEEGYKSIFEIHARKRMRDPRFTPCV